MQKTEIRSKIRAPFWQILDRGGIIYGLHYYIVISLLIDC